jgi:hypothetical protein
MTGVCGVDSQRSVSQSSRDLMAVAGRLPANADKSAGWGASD